METLGRGFAWLDTGNHDALLDAADFVAAFQKRQGMYISCIEEIAYPQRFYRQRAAVEAGAAAAEDQRMASISIDVANGLIILNGIQGRHMKNGKNYSRNTVISKV